MMEELRRASVDAVPALMSFFDADHICRFANEHHRQWYGRAPQDLTGAHMRDFVGAQAYLARRPWLDRVARGETVAFENTVPHRDGTQRHASIRYVPRMGPAGFEGFFVLVVDIAPQLHRYHRIFEATVVAFWEIDLSDMHAALSARLAAAGGDPVAWLRAHPAFSRASLDRCPVLDLNSRAEQMFGVSRQEALASPFGRWCPPACEQHMLENLIAYLSGRDGFEGETQMRRADGSLFPVHISTAFPRQAVSRPAGTFAIMDISERAAREQALAQAHAELAHAARVATLGELTAAIAHEVNQPLAAIVTNGNAALRWLRRPVPDLGETREAIERMIGEGTRAAQIITRTRQLASKGSAERVRVACAPLLAEAVAIVERQIAGLGARLRIDLAEDLPPIHADRIQMQQVIINLLVNAAQAMAEHGSPQRTIDLRAFAHGEHIAIEVVDTGPGFAQEQAGQLFNAFYTTKAGGMGIGLSVSKTIVEAHGGTITATSQAGQGASFHVHLPPARDDPPPA
jgi:PAS domain S-box-containing protein